jgi:putative hydrolase of HD superfamily
MNIKNIVNFIFELNQLKRQIHSGWLYAGIKNPDSVAEHALRAAQIGYILAVMEGDANPEKVVTMLAIHDNAEARIGDQNKVSARYYSNKDAEEKAMLDQLDNLGKAVSNKWKKYFLEYENRNTKEGIIAKDADWLEQAFQAKEYVDLGFYSAEDWILNVEKALETKSAKLLIKEMKKTKFTDWWQGLKKMTYKKLK